jgi:uncharacterized protein YqgC (DUF456 family)
VYLLAAALAFVNLLWLFTTVLGLPGNWLMVLTTALVAWWQWEAAMFSPWTLLAVILLATGGELVDVVAGAVMAKRAGGTGRGALGAILGGVAGGLVGTAMLPVPLFGTILGVCAGAFIGAAVLEAASGQPIALSLRSGRGAAVGYGLGYLAKLGIGAVIWATVAVAAFWP